MSPDTHSHPGTQFIAPRWTIGLTFLVSLVALLATSEPPTYFYSGERSLASIPLELSASTPSRTVLIEVKQVAAFANGQWPRSIAVRVQAVFGAQADARWVLASIRRVEPPEASPTQEAVLTRFEHSFEAPFAGQCSNPPSSTSPCRTRFSVEFAREEGGAAEGTVYGQLDIQLSERVTKANSPSEVVELPISVEVTES